MKRQASEPKLGDHFQLVLPKVSRKDMGWYRCIRRINNTVNIANMYYIDVVTNSTPEIVSLPITNSFIYRIEILKWKSIHLILRFNLFQLQHRL